MEVTIQEYFSAMSQIRGILHDTSSTSVVTEILHQAREQYEEDDDFVQEVLGQGFAVHVQPDGKRARLDGVLVTALKDAYRSDNRMYNTERFYHVYPQWWLNGVRYDATHEGDSLVCIKSVQDPRRLIPGVIQRIFSLAPTARSEDIIFAVRLYKPCPFKDDTSLNPFLRYPDFRAQLLSMELDKPIAVNARSLACHGVRRPWTEDTVVIRPLNKVGSLFLFCTYEYVCTGHVTSILSAFRLAEQFLWVVRLPETRFTLELRIESCHPTHLTMSTAALLLTEVFEMEPRKMKHDPVFFIIAQKWIFCGYLDARSSRMASINQRLLYLGTEFVDTWFCLFRQWCRSI